MFSFSRIFGKNTQPAMAFQAASAESAPPVNLPVEALGTAAGRDGGAQKPAAEKPYPWILNPTLDWMFACGGLLWLLWGAFMLGAQPALNAGIAAGAMWFIAKLGLITFSYGHQPATLWRVYMSKRTREQCGLTVTIWLGVAIAALCAGIFVKGFVEVFVKLVIWWQIQHVLAQSYGVALIYCYKRGYFMNELEKRTFYWMIHASVAFFIIRSCTFPEFSKLRLPFNMQVPFWGPLPMPVYNVAAVVAGGLAIAFLYNIYAKWKRDGKMFPMPALAGVATGMLTYQFSMLFFHTGFALLTIAFYHGCQYLVVTSSYYLKERGLPEGLTSAQVSRALLSGPAVRYFLAVIVVGVLLSDTLPRVLSFYGIGISIAATYTAVFAAFNFHHYFSDALIWRLKDPELRKILIA